jgi:hypothetical protein
MHKFPDLDPRTIRRVCNPLIPKSLGEMSAAYSLLSTDFKAIAVDRSRIYDRVRRRLAYYVNTNAFSVTMSTRAQVVRS